MIKIEEKNFKYRLQQAEQGVRCALCRQFGFAADPKKNIRHNASIQLAAMPTWYYFSHPSHLAFHDFTLHNKPPKNLRSLLDLGLKFIPTPNSTTKWSKIKKFGLERLQRNIQLRFHFANETTNNDDNDNNDDYDPKLYIGSAWSPPNWTYPKFLLDERIGKFSDTLSKKFRRRHGKSNLLPHQRRALSHLMQQKDFLIAPCDKNLGPAIIETDDYLALPSGIT